MRIFTNESVTVNALVRADDRLEPVAWNDPLSLGRLSVAGDFPVYAAERAKVLEAFCWDDFASLESDFNLRFAELNDVLSSGEEIHLLFGGSLKDQLQLAQILCWMSYRSEKAIAQTRVVIVDGPLSIFDDGALLEVAKEGDRLDFTTLEAYRSAWLAVTSSDPSFVELTFRRLTESREQLALAAALERWLQELPSVDNGLSVSECQLLDAIRLGVQSPRELFEAVEETEAAPFRVDWEFWQLIDQLAAGEDPAICTKSGDAFLCPPKDMAWDAFYAQELELTNVGERLLDGTLHNSQRSQPEHWLGGVRIAEGCDWFWDYASQSIRRELGVLGA